MKNFILGAAALAMFSTISAADVVVDENTDAAIEEVSNVSDLFTRIYFGLGIGLKSTKLEATTDTPALQAAVDTSNTNFIGSLLLGGGKAFNNKWYLGLEAVCDFASNKKTDFFDLVRLKNGGTVPSFMVRAGYIIPSSKLMVYLKAGVALLRDKFIIIPVQATAKMNKAAPVLALGVEKASNNKLSLRTEIEYSFKADKTSNLLGYDVKVKNKGVFNWRVFAVYNINM